MHFGNFKHILYIALSASTVLVFFAAYCIWKRRTLRIMAPGLILGSRKIALAREILVMISIALFALTALRPQWGELMREAKSEGTDVLIALDVSPSMLARDVDPSRLDRAKSAIKWIVESLNGDRVGLILFSGDAFLQCPLTNDYGAFMMFLDAAGPDAIRLRGTDIGRALGEAARVFNKKRLTSRMLVVITDGEDHEGNALDAAQAFREMDVSVYAVGVGGESGEVVPLGKGEADQGNYQRDAGGSLVKTRKNPGLLKKVAGLTHGTYIDISRDLSGLKFILEIIDEQQKNQYKTRIVRERKERYQFFALALILLLAAELMLPERSRRV